MTSKPKSTDGDAGEGVGPDSRRMPLGRNRSEPLGGEVRAPGPVFESPPPQHPLLARMHTFWIEADADSIGWIMDEAAAIADEAPDEIRPWAESYLRALEDLSAWLRDL